LIKMKKKPKAYIMTGNCGIGKSYFAKKFATKHNLKYFSIDDMYIAFNGDSKSRENKFQVWITFYQQIHAAEQARYDIVIDVNNPTPFDRQEWLNWFPDFEHHLIWIDGTFEIAEYNNRERERKIPADIFEMLFHNYQPPTYEELNNYNHRAQYKSGSLIVNNSNNFSEIQTFYGKFPFYKEEV